MLIYARCAMRFWWFIMSSDIQPTSTNIMMIWSENAGWSHKMVISGGKPWSLGGPCFKTSHIPILPVEIAIACCFYRAFSRVDFGVVSQLVWVELPGGRINFEIMMWRGRIDFHRNYAADIHAGTGPHVPWYSPNFIGDYSRLSATWLG